MLNLGELVTHILHILVLLHQFFVLGEQLVVLVVNFLQLSILLLQSRQCLLIRLYLIFRFVHPLEVTVLRESLLQVVQLPLYLFIGRYLLFILSLLFIEGVITTQEHALIYLVPFGGHCILFKRLDAGHQALHCFNYFIACLLEFGIGLLNLLQRLICYLFRDSRVLEISILFIDDFIIHGSVGFAASDQMRTDHSRLFSAAARTPLLFTAWFIKRTHQGFLLLGSP